MHAAVLALCLLLQPAPEPLPARPVISNSEGGLKSVVRDRHGAPVPGVRILLKGPGGRTWTALTDAQGLCQAGSLPPGEYRVELRKEAHPLTVYPRLTIRAHAWLLGAPPPPGPRGARLGLTEATAYEEAPGAPIVPLRREPGKIPMH